MLRLDSSLKNFINDWNLFWFSAEIPPYFNLFVKAFGLTYFLFYLERLLNFKEYFTKSGAYYFKDGHLNDYFSLLPIEVMFAIYAVSLLLSLSWVFFPARLWNKIYVYVIHVFLLNQNLNTTYGADSYAALILFYFLFIDFTKGTNLRSRLALQCFKFHFCFTYINSGLGKLTGLSWVFGDGIYWAVFTHAQPEWFDVFKNSPGLLTLMSHGTILLEIFGPVFIWTRYANVFVFLFIMLHVGIMLTMGLYGFALICCSTFLIFIKKESPAKSQLPAQRADIPETDLLR